MNFFSQNQKFLPIHTKIQCKKEHFLHMQKKFQVDPILCFFTITAKRNKKRFSKKTRLKFRETFDCCDDYIPLLKTSSRIV